MADEIKNEEQTNIDEGKETNPTDESLSTEEQSKESVGNQRIPYERFKAKVDEANALKEKLAEIEREQEEAKRKELEEQEKYKELYEQALADAKKAQEQAIATRKAAALANAGYSEEQANFLLANVEGETTEEITESIEKLKQVFPIEDGYGDPNAFNSATQKPETVDADEIEIG